MIDFQLIYAFLVGLTDPIRGGTFKLPSKVGTILHSWAVAAVLGIGFEMLSIPLIILLTAGESFGWGTPMANVLYDEKRTAWEQWQVGILRKYQSLALAVRGFIWALPAQALWWYDHRVALLIPAMSFSFVAAPYISKKVFPKLEQRWSKNEVVRGLLTGLSLYLMTKYF